MWMVGNAYCNSGYPMLLNSRLLVPLIDNHSYRRGSTYNKFQNSKAHSPKTLCIVESQFTALESIYWQVTCPVVVSKKQVRAAHTVLLLADRLDPRPQKGKGWKVKRGSRGLIRGVRRCKLERCSIDPVFLSLKLDPMSWPYLGAPSTQNLIYHCIVRGRA